MVQLFYEEINIDVGGYHRTRVGVSVGPWVLTRDILRILLAIKVIENVLTRHIRTLVVGAVRCHCRVFGYSFRVSEIKKETGQYEELGVRVGGLLASLPECSDGQASRAFIITEHYIVPGR